MAVAAGSFASSSASAQGASAPSAAWTLAGRQGIIRVVIVPTGQAHDRAAYLSQIALLCEPQMSCFINFFTNSTNAPVSVPLPDAIEHEATAIFRRSTKQGGEFLRWSCRMKMEEGDCF